MKEADNVRIDSAGFENEFELAGALSVLSESDLKSQLIEFRTLIVGA